ncbi:class I SAM-dependent methyltransferase [Olivibacter sp. SDN3]|uniref:class I SAM-dependent methyltransferase n=1 Tax=Olivibacter sp. SDN3 TaxID=2764720 RepID=UPI0016512BA3|nr:class I SAM-dependent methyltransferase [Olivibacter sp. SDN3]QNL51419.1 class I SAM-dependent methyltransferase [Olivibacter sp. SDN3]
MSEPLKEEAIVSYYNTVVQTKLHNYLYGNPRVDEAWKTIVNYKPTPSRPLRILEVGCGVGAICHRMHEKWPTASITGIDISSRSIEIANKLFSNSKTKFIEGILTPDTVDGKFDLIIFMDVYEHIAVADRPVVHAAIKKLLDNKGRLILSVPTPHNLKWSAVHKPETMQPVDEHISLAVINTLALDTDTEVLLYQIKDIWNVGDYAHIVFEKNNDFEQAFFNPKPVSIGYKVIRGIKRVRQQVLGKIRESKAKRKLG